MIRERFGLYGDECYQKRESFHQAASCEAPRARTLACKRELPMTKEELAHLERRLLEERARITKRLARSDELSAERLSGSKDAGSVYTFHMAEQGTDSKEREMAFLQASKEGRFLQHIDEALRRLHKTPEQYGLCGACGSEIGFERLDVLPHARLCIICKEGEKSAAAPTAAWG